MWNIHGLRRRTIFVLLPIPCFQTAFGHASRRFGAVFAPRLDVLVEHSNQMRFSRFLKQSFIENFIYEAIPKSAFDGKCVELKLVYIYSSKYHGALYIYIDTPQLHRLKLFPGGNSKILVENALRKCHKFTEMCVARLVTKISHPQDKPSILSKNSRTRLKQISLGEELLMSCSPVARWSG